MESRQPLISVIVPVYKTEKYLRQCVASICGQSYPQLEVILIDDGSPDNCPSICDALAAQDARIVVVHKQNEGVSIARNLALERCRGDLISFADSDDWLEQGLYSRVVEEFEQQPLSCVCFAANLVSEAGEKQGEDYRYFQEKTVLPVAEVKRLVLRDEMSSHPWRAVFRRKCWEQVRFPKGRFYEDLAVTYQAYSHTTEPVLFLPDCFYNYRMNPGGTSLGGNPMNNYDIFTAFREHYEVALREDEKTRAVCLAKAADFALGTYSNIEAGRFPAERAACCKKTVYGFLRENRREILHSKELKPARKWMMRTALHLPILYRQLCRIAVRSGRK